MTEAEWLASSSFEDILKFFPANASVRSVRLFAVACCRRLPSLDQRSLQALDVAERFAEGLADQWALHRAYQVAFGNVERHENNPENERSSDAVRAVAWATVPVGTPLRESAAYAAYHAGRADAGPAERRVQALLLTDIMAPSLSAPLSAAVLAWSGGTVPRLAAAIYDDRKMPEGTLDSARLAILADALLDAGCEDEDLMAHCRSGGPHVRGCWAVDLVLGKG
jgi:hypothetical protein